VVKIPKTSELRETNLYELSGDGIHVTYSTTSFTGQPQFVYQDAQGTKTFSGSQIKVEKCELGTLVSVVLLMTVDSGSTTFTLLVPNVGLPFGDVAQIDTLGIVTVHRFSIVGPPHGQREFYTAHQLHGTAAFVIA
jgi:hypothetical protein